MASSKGSDSNRNRTPRNTERERTVKVFKTEMRMNIPAGVVPKMPAEDLKVDWTFVEIDFRGHIGRFQGLNEILDEEIGKTPDEIDAQKVKYGHSVNVLLSLLQELISLNDTARLQLRNYWQNNPDFK